jgi:hypothetical protein
MAKKETTNKMGADQPYYRTPGGVIHPVAYMANDITGTPPPPGYRMGPGPVGSGNIPDSDPRTSENPVLRKFFSKDRG